MNSLKIAIVGSNGFIGSALSRSLATKKNVEIFQFKRPEFDLIYPKNWSLSSKLDAVIICAGVVSGDFNTLHKVNVAGVENLARHCREQAAKRLILLSSGAVYSETFNKTYYGMTECPSSDYGKSKLDGEFGVKKAWGASAGLAILRPYFPYGRGQQMPRLIPRLFKQILVGDPVFCRPDGGPLLTLTHIDDLIFILNRDFIFGDKQGIFNIASDHCISIKHIAIKIGKLLGREPIFEYINQEKNHISFSYDEQYSWRKFDPRDLLANRGE